MLVVYPYMCQEERLSQTPVAFTVRFQQYPMHSDCILLLENFEVTFIILSKFLMPFPTNENIMVTYYILYFYQKPC